MSFDLGLGKLIVGLIQILDDLIDPGFIPMGIGVAFAKLDPGLKLRVGVDDAIAAAENTIVMALLAGLIDQCFTGHVSGKAYLGDCRYGTKEGA